MPFSHNIEKKENYFLLNLSGTLLDKNSATDLLEESEKLLIDSEIKNIIVNLSMLEYLNSSGLNVLINLLTKTRNAGGEMILTGISEKIEKLFLITKLQSVFSIADDIKSAETLLNSSVNQ
jgi:anti-sigma B factor antagonist